MKPHLANHSFLIKRPAMIPLIIFVIMSVLLPALLSGCAAAPAEPVSRTEFHLNTVVSITLYDRQGTEKDTAILDGCMSLIEKYELLFSRTDPHSELYRLNHGLLPQAANGVPTADGVLTSGVMPTGSGQIVSDELAEVIRLGLYYSELSDGAFDITIAPVSDLWNFSGMSEESLLGEQDGAFADGAASGDSSGGAASGDSSDGAASGDSGSESISFHPVPDQAAIVDAKRHVDYHNVLLSQSEEGNFVFFLAEDMSIDLGAIAKGYIADRLREYLLENGVENAIINLGGNVLCMGSKNGQPYKVGIQRPFAAQGESIMILSLTDISLVSSGTYERYFEADGNFYHHILDPSTGYPCGNGLSGVTILADSSADADALSTACFLLGPEKGLVLIESLPEAEALFITDTEELIYSSGFPR